MFPDPKESRELGRYLALGQVGLEMVVPIALASAAFWLLLALPARRLGGGDAAVVYSGTALALCLVPAVVTLLWAGWALDKSPEQQLTLVLGGTGMRLFVVLGSAWALFASVPY